jgi:hypothetical protein
MAVEELGLAEAIEAVRSELRRAQDAGRGSDVRFAVGSVEMEFAVNVAKTGGGQVSVTVLGLLSLGGKGGLSREETHRVKISLNPIGVGDTPFEVASAAAHRPDGKPGQ